MFEGFTLHHIATPEATIRARIGGSGPPLLLLHGNPQTHVMWHGSRRGWPKHFTVVAADLRGYGDSSKPETTPDHEPYSKRAMARDQVAVMRHFGFERFAVAGHDRGGRVRLPHGARSSGARGEARACSTSCRRSSTTAAPTWRSPLAYWHWFFLIQPYPLPEKNDRRRPEMVLQAELAGRAGAAEVLRIPRRSPIIGAPSAIPKPCTRSARITAPARPTT